MWMKLSSPTPIPLSVDQKQIHQKLSFLKELYWQRNHKFDFKKPQPVCELKQLLHPNLHNGKRVLNGSLNLPPIGTCLPMLRSVVTRRMKIRVLTEKRAIENNSQNRQNQGPIQELPQPPRLGPSQYPRFQNCYGSVIVWGLLFNFFGRSPFGL